MRGSRHETAAAVRRSAVVVDRFGIATDQVVRYNRRRGETTAAARRRLARWFDRTLGLRLILIPSEPGDPVRHADGYCNALAPRILAIARYPQEPLRSFHDGVAASLRRRLPRSIRIVRLPYLPPDAFLKKGERADPMDARGNYVNFHRHGDVVLVPSYGAAADDKAIETLRRAAPSLEYIPIPCSTLARQGGAIHCVTAKLFRDDRKAPSCDEGHRGGDRQRRLVGAMT